MRTLTLQEANDAGYEFVDGEIIAYSGNEVDLVIPSMIGDEEVKRIFESCFSDKGLVSVVIPDTVEVINERAFSNNRIKNLVLSKNIKHIGDSAFYNNNIESDLTLPLTLKTIDSDSFAKAVSGTVTVNAPLEAFIGYNPFLNNPNVRFKLGDSSSKFYLIVNNVVITGHESLTDIPEGVTRIGSCAFENVPITYVNIPKTLTNIDFLAFSDTKIVDVTLYSEVEFYSTNVFPTDTIVRGPYNSEAMNMFKNNYIVVTQNPNGHLTFEQANQIGLTLDDSTGMLSSLRVLQGELIIPKSIGGIEVTGVSQAAFFNSNLTKIVFPNTIRVIGDFAFQSNKLEELELPSTLTHIGRSAFAFNSIRTLHIPESVQEVLDSAFSWNPLDTVELYSPTLHDNVFNGLGDIKMKFTTLGTSCFGILRNSTYLVDESTKTLIHSSEDFVPEQVTSIAHKALTNNQSEHLYIHRGIHTLGSRVFDLAKIKSLYLPNSIKYIQADTFEGLSSSMAVIVETGTSEVVTDALRKQGIEYFVSTIDYPVSSKSTLSTSSIFNSKE